MTRDDIIKWAHEAQLPFYFPTGELAYSNELMRFAELVAAEQKHGTAPLEVFEDAIWVLDQLWDKNSGPEITQQWASLLSKYGKEAMQ